MQEFPYLTAMFDTIGNDCASKSLTGYIKPLLAFQEGWGSNFQADTKLSAPRHKTRFKELS